VNDAPAPSGRAFANVRPKDAATLIVLRRDPDAVRVLMGRRADAHAFMPGAVVFPGGKVERSDRYAPSLDELHPAVEAKLLLSLRKPDPGRARAIALAAIRETYEETGVLLGRRGPAPQGLRGEAWSPFLNAGVVPSLSPLRLIARAVTPPGRFSRRFDARFLAVFADAIAAEVASPEGELQRPAWLTFEEARRHDIPRITRAVLDGLARRLQEDAILAPDGPVPFHVMRRGRFHVDLL
jgi:8-oxo-dGTP pyrophosphatase MutT (NUDIX family)